MSQYGWTHLCVFGELRPATGASRAMRSVDAARSSQLLYVTLASQASPAVAAAEDSVGVGGRAKLPATQ